MAYSSPLASRHATSLIIRYYAGPSLLARRGSHGVESKERSNSANEVVLLGSGGHRVECHTRREETLGEAGAAVVDVSGELGLAERGDAAGVVEGELGR